MRSGPFGFGENWSDGGFFCGRVGESTLFAASAFHWERLDKPVEGHTALSPVRNGKVPVRRHRPEAVR